MRVRMRCVVDDENAARSADAFDPLHLAGLSAVMDWHHRFDERVLRDRPFKCGGVDVQRARININKHRLRAAADNGLRRRGERHDRSCHLVAWTYAENLQRQLQPRRGGA